MTDHKARTFAIQKHGNQMYGDKVYAYHLDKTVDVLKFFGFSSDEMISAGYLHDTIEDTGTKYSEIEKNFGKEIAEIVYDVTDELGRNRKEIKAKTYPKLSKNKKAILIKLADRIANVEASILLNNTQKFEMYQGEFADFFHNLCFSVNFFYSESSEGHKMFRHLAKLLGKEQLFRDIFEDLV